MIRLILADDHAMLREGLRRKFEDNPDLRVTGEAASAAELLQRLNEAPADVVILDVKLPDANGISLIKKIKTIAPSIRVVILTMYNHARYALHAIQSGADGFVVKGAPFEELERAVRTVFTRRTYVCSELAPELIGRFRRPQPDSPADSLSQREFEVLTMLSSGLTLKETASRMHLSKKTVSTYRTRLMVKLNLNGNTDLVRFALESGLIE